MKRIMLALSTYRHSQTAVEAAIEQAQEGKRLIIVYVIDVNLARYLIGSDIGTFQSLKETYESELLDKHRVLAAERIAGMVTQAEHCGINVSTHITTGRFALECLEIMQTEQPDVIVTTRSKRPKWVKRFFGSPVDYLKSHAQCPVIEA